VDIPIPQGGLGLPNGDSVTIDANATVQINVKRDGDGNVVGYYVVVNNAPENNEAAGLFGELAQETAIARLEQLAGEILTTGATIALRAAGLIVGVLATLLTPSHLTREVFIRCDLDMGNNTDGPPVTYCLLVAG
jgi:hypothetical protein